MDVEEYWAYDLSQLAGDDVRRKRLQVLSSIFRSRSVWILRKRENDGVECPDIEADRTGQRDQLRIHCWNSACFENLGDECPEYFTFVLDFGASSEDIKSSVHSLVPQCSGLIFESVEKAGKTVEMGDSPWAEPIVYGRITDILCHER